MFLFRSSDADAQAIVPDTMVAKAGALVARATDAPTLHSTQQDGGCGAHAQTKHMCSLVTISVRDKPSKNTYPPRHSHKASKARSASAPPRGASSGQPPRAACPRPAVLCTPPAPPHHQCSPPRSTLWPRAPLLRPHLTHERAPQGGCRLACSGGGGAAAAAAPGPACGRGVGGRQGRGMQAV